MYFCNASSVLCNVAVVRSTSPTGTCRCLPKCSLVTEYRASPSVKLKSNKSIFMCSWIYRFKFMP